MRVQIQTVQEVPDPMAEVYIPDSNGRNPKKWILSKVFIDERGVVRGALFSTEDLSLEDANILCELPPLCRTGDIRLKPHEETQLRDFVLRLREMLKVELNIELAQG